MNHLIERFCCYVHNMKKIGKRIVPGPAIEMENGANEQTLFAASPFKNVVQCVILLLGLMKKEIYKGRGGEGEDEGVAADRKPAKEQYDTLYYSTSCI